MVNLTKTTIIAVQTPEEVKPKKPSTDQIIEELMKVNGLLNLIKKEGLFDLDENVQKAFICTLLDEVSSKLEVHTLDLLDELTPMIEEVNDELGAFAF